MLILPVAVNVVDRVHQDYILVSKVSTPKFEFLDTIIVP